MGGDNLKDKLIRETKKWLESMEIELLDNSYRDFVENINTYIEDTRYFLEKQDYIRAFEAIVWAWLEIGERIGLLRGKV